jgi:ABC-type polysaccharide/polyol phosphate export permease
MRTRYVEWALGLLWILAAAGALTILISLAIGAKWMLTASSLAASVALLGGSAIASQVKPSRRAPVRVLEHC